MSDWKEFFAFTRQERNGIIVLCALIAAVLFYLFMQSSVADSSDTIVVLPQEFLEHEAQEDSGTISDVRNPRNNQEGDEAVVPRSRSVFQDTRLFPFNPNGLPEEDWVKLGLSPAQAKSLKNFESKGGVFRTKEDVKKMYVISPEKYLELEPYIFIPEHANDSAVVRTKKETGLIYELNTADTSMLVKINGIGPVFAARIVAYRARLGGFHHKEQLKEVYGIDDEKYSLVQGSIKVDSSYINKININTVEASELRRHPYFTPGVANAIVNYRKLHGPFKVLSDIMKCHLVNADLYRKIAPYLII